MTHHYPISHIGVSGSCICSLQCCYDEQNDWCICDQCDRNACANRHKPKPDQETEAVSDMPEHDRCPDSVSITAVFYKVWRCVTPRDACTSEDRKPGHHVWGCGWRWVGPELTHDQVANRPET